MFIYKLLSILLYPFIAIYIFSRSFFGKESHLRIGERFGFAGVSRPKGQVIWIHGVSVGEMNSGLVLVDELLKKYPKVSILFTTTTLTSAKILGDKIKKDYGNRVIHQFLPVDCYFAADGFLSFWQPRIALFLESEVWPNLIHIARKKYAIASVLVNARMSDKSAKKWLIARKLGFKIFDYYAFIFAQTFDDKNRFEKLTNQEILFYGNLKSQAANLSFDKNELEILQQKIGSRKFWLAASTHKGEEEKIIFAHKKLKQKYPDLLTILVPRHPNRAAEIKPLMNGINFSQRSQNEAITNQTEIYFADTLGELGLFYKLADFAFIGGSFAEVGGHNPFEPTKLDCAIISGIHTFNFRGIYEKLIATNSCKIVRNENELYEVVDEFLEDKNLYKTQLQRAKEAIKDGDETAQKIVKKLSEFLVLD